MSITPSNSYGTTADHAQETPGETPEAAADAPKRRLGRGLNALLGGSGPAATPTPLKIAEVGDSEAGELRHVPLANVEASPFQPRRVFDTDELNDLVGSIREHGVLAPVLVREVDGGFQLIAGERRLRAAKMAGLETVPVRVVDVVDQTACEYSLEENLKRSDLNDIEKARAFKRYIEQFQTTKEELARHLSMSRPAVANLLRLLDLPEPVRKAVEEGLITGGHAKAILSLDDEADMLTLCGRVQSEGLSVRKTESEARRMKDERETPATIPFKAADPKKGNSNAKKSKTPHVLQLESQLREQFGVKAEIKCSAKSKGSIVLPFGDSTEFERLMNTLKTGEVKAA